MPYPPTTSLSPSPAPAAREAQRAVVRYVRRLGRRALWWRVALGLSLGLGGLGLSLVATSWLAGPTVSLGGAVVGWLTVCAATLGAGWFALRDLGGVRGARAARQLRAHDAELASQLQSAAELGAHPNGSSALVLAHAAQVRQRLASVPPRAVSSAGRASRLSALLGLALAGGSVWALNDLDRCTAGLYALVHPGLRDAEGTPLARWVRELEVEAQFPRHLGREPRTLRDPRAIRVPSGTRLTLRVTPRVQIARATLALGDSTVPFDRADDGTFRLALSAERSGTVALRARTDDAWWTDPTPRHIEVIADGAPRVALERPSGDLQASPQQTIKVRYKAQDDHGLQSVTLVIRGPGAAQRRIALKEVPADQSARALEGEHALRPAELGAEGGHTLSFWVEARDRDEHAGPNVGRSEIRTLTVRSERDGASAPVALLTDARDECLDLLADRLETPLPDGARTARARHRELAKSTRAFATTLDELRRRYERSAEGAATAELVAAMARRVRELLRGELSLYRRGGHQRQRAEADRDAVSELEGDALWLTDLLGKARLSRAHDILDDLDQLRERMRQLLSELKRSEDPERRRALLAEVARARAKLAELARRLQDVQQDVPADFINRDALKVAPEQSALAQLERAAREGDLEAAAKALDQLDAELRAMRSGLTETGASFAQSRFGPRSAAAAKARAALEALREGQQRLNEQTDAVAREAARRNQPTPAQQRAAARLATEAEQLAKQTRRLKASRVSNEALEQQSRTAQRLEDARDALRQGDLFEARRMAQQASESARGMALEFAYGARRGRAGQRRAEQAKAHRRQLRQWAERLEAQLPDRPPPLTPAQRRQLRQAAPGQRQLRERGQRLAGKLAEESGDDGVSQGLGRALKPALEAMQRAADAMEREQLREAASHQQEALDKLSRLSDQLRRQQGAGGGRRRVGRGRGAHERPHERMAIPDQASDPRRAALRRRVLDARRARTPRAYRDRVDRYYEEILR